LLDWELQLFDFDCLQAMFTSVSLFLCNTTSIVQWMTRVLQSFPSHPLPPELISLPRRLTQIDRFVLTCFKHQSIDKSTFVWVAEAGRCLLNN